MTKSTGRPTVAPQTAMVPAYTSEDGGMLSPPLGQVAQRIQSRHVTAVACQIPRSLQTVRNRCVEEATMCGESFFYSYTVGSKEDDKKKKGTIEGISIDGAMVILRNFMNSSCEVDVIGEDPTHWTFAATFIDYETGFTHTRLYRQRKSERHGRFDADRALDIAYQIGQSKSIRNVVSRSVPVWLVDACMEAAHLSAEEKYKDVKKEWPNFLKAFLRYGVTEEMMLKRAGVTSISDLLPRDLVLFRTLGTAIRDRQTTVEDEFDMNPPAPADETVQPPAPEDVPTVQQPAGDREAANRAYAQDQKDAHGAPPAPRCDGNHGEPACQDPQCWLTGDREPAPKPAATKATKATKPPKRVQVVDEHDQSIPTGEGGDKPKGPEGQP